MTVGDLDRSVAFYTRALGFALEDEAALEGEAFARLMGVASARARSATLALGDERIELLAFETPGEPYPSESHGPDLWFQHFAIVVDDMRQAFGRLCDAGLSPISTDGPQILPSRSGGATAFKFRDPDGHPLELLAFAAGQAPARWQDWSPGPLLGIDHSAIAVADTARSEAFYVGMLGLRPRARSVNKGVEQERLDDTFNAVVEVTGLEIGDGSGPHVELLCYRVPPTGRPIPRTTRSDAIAATRLVLETADLEGLAGEAAEKRMQLISPGLVPMPDGTRALALRDPDGHQLIFQQ